MELQIRILKRMAFKLQDIDKPLADAIKELVYELEQDQQHIDSIMERGSHD